MGNGKASEDRAGAAPAKRLLELISTERGHFSPHRRAFGSAIIDARSRRLSKPRRGRAVAVTIAALGIAGGAFGWEYVRTSSLSYAVEGGHVDGEGVIETDRQSPPIVRFSDGSEVALGANAQARVRSTYLRGAWIALTDGRARVDIVHAPGTRWLFEAGPFVVTVTGTAFTLGWEAAGQNLDLRMDRGSVEVSSPLSDGPIVLRAGQHLIVHLRERETQIREDALLPAVDRARLEPTSPPAALGSGDASADEPREGVSNSAGAGGPRSARADRTGEHWAAELAAGEFETIVAQAERIGFETCLAIESEKGLSALADAARYSRHDDLARRALLAEQRRFPESAEARDANFLVGRLEEASGDTNGALALYAGYCAENPNATYASEALGRRMSLTRKLFGDRGARPLAEEYLRRFPEGTYSATARVLSATR